MLRRGILLIGLLVMLLPAAGALAGGWVVITLEAMPEQMRAGEPLTLSFMVRQHGKTPTHDVSPVLTATNKDTGRQIRAEAAPASKVGRFTVEVSFPVAGDWEWSISAEPFQQTATFAPLTVLAAETAAGPKRLDQTESGKQTAPQKIDPVSAGQKAAVPGQKMAPEQAAGPVKANQSGTSAQMLFVAAGLTLLGAAALLFALGRRRERKVTAAASGD